MESQEFTLIREKCTGITYIHEQAFPPRTKHCIWIACPGCRDLRDTSHTILTLDEQWVQGRRKANKSMIAMFQELCLSLCGMQRARKVVGAPLGIRRDFPMKEGESSLGKAPEREVHGAGGDVSGPPATWLVPWTVLRCLDSVSQQWPACHPVLSGCINSDTTPQQSPKLGTWKASLFCPHPSHPNSYHVLLSFAATHCSNHSAFNPHYQPPLFPKIPKPEGKKKGGSISQKKRGGCHHKRREGDARNPKSTDVPGTNNSESTKF